MACQEQAPSPVAPDAPGPAFSHKPGHSPGGKKGGGGGNGGGDKATWSFAAARAGDVGTSPATLISSCPAMPGSKNTSPTLVWPRHDMCANVTPEGQTGPTIITLTDDPVLVVKTKGDQILAVSFRQQDVIGPDGIQFESEEVPIDPPVTFTGAGFVLKINTSGVNVWQLKGHTGGPRVRIIGTMNFGEVVYCDAVPCPP
ncbi:MAG: hypothetical protein ACE5HP_02760 [Gemmatimonadota bacterium]